MTNKAIFWQFVQNFFGKTWRVDLKILVRKAVELLSSAENGITNFNDNFRTEDNMTNNLGSDHKEKTCNYKVWKNILQKVDRKTRRIHDDG